MKATKETTTTDPAERLEPDTAPTWTVLTFSNNKRRPLTFLSPPPPPFSGRHAADHGDEREHRTIDGPSGVRSGFHPVSADELLNNEPEPVVWVWHRFIASGRLTLLSAYAKVGKSTFAYQLAIAVAQGRPFLDLPTTQGPVLILAVEEHAQDVQRRLRDFGANADDPIHIHTGALGPDDLPVVEAFVREHRITLVLLDTLSRFWRIKDENDNAEIIRVVGPLLEMGQRTGCAVLIIHHEKKRGDDDGDAGIRAIRGGSALAGIVDQSLQLGHRHGGARNQRVLKAVGRYAETPATLVIELIGAEYRRVDEVQDKVWAALTAQPQTEEQLLAAAGVARAAFQRAIKALGGKVVRGGDGRRGSPYTYRLEAQEVCGVPLASDSIDHAHMEA